MWPNHALQRTRHGAVGSREDSGSPSVPWAGSLSLGRYATSHAESFR
jgi:hypothetical protein